MKRNELVKTILLIFVIIGLTFGSAMLLNIHTAPLIAANELGVLGKYLPGGKGFEDITGTLTLPEGVSKVYKETSGKGFVLEVSEQGYSKKVNVTVGITAEGKVAAVGAETNGDYAVGAGTFESYVGQDSTLANVVHTSGATASSNAVKKAVEVAFNVLSSNNLMAAAVKTTEQVFEELLPSIVSGFGKGKALSQSGDIYEAYEVTTENAVVCYVNKGETKLVVVTNVTGYSEVYESVLLNEFTQEYELKDVTSENADVITSVESYVATHLTNTKPLTALNTKVMALYPSATNITEVKLNVFGSVSAALSFEVEGSTYYAYIAKPVNSFNNELMEIFVILDNTGKIANVNISELFFEEQYFMQKPNINKGEYEAGFNGLIGEAYDGSQALIAGATCSQKAINQAISDVFAAFAKGGNN